MSIVRTRSDGDRTRDEENASSSLIADFSADWQAQLELARSNHPDYCNLQKFAAFIHNNTMPQLSKAGSRAQRLGNVGVTELRETDTPVPVPSQDTHTVHTLAQHSARASEPCNS